MEVLFVDFSDLENSIIGQNIVFVIGVNPIQIIQCILPFPLIFHGLCFAKQNFICQSVIRKYRIDGIIEFECALELMLFQQQICLCKLIHGCVITVETQIIGNQNG
ncbi:hypothetical protein D3C80_1470480 [compost metagenome]